MIEKRNKSKDKKEFKKIKNKKEKTPEQIKRKKKIKIFILVLIVILTLYIGISTAISLNKFKKLIKDMSVNENSIVIDSDGNTIAEIGSEKTKEKIKAEEIPSNLKNAYVAIEDERYYKHGGVDVKRTTSAIISYVFHRGSSSFGGSSITQQLVKNLTGDSSNKISRKVNEWEKAITIESFMSKDEILELYLNIIYVGPNIYGVESGSQYYFNKSAKDLTLEECAFLAGINNSPNSYNPFNGDNTNKINKRTKTVLSKMLELKYINQEEYEKAINNIIINGIKYSPKDENLIVRLYKKGYKNSKKNNQYRAYLEIENTGVTIDKKYLGEIFNPFFRIEKSRSRKTGGSGLGLYLVSQILKSHGYYHSLKNKENSVVFTIEFKN